MLKTPITFCNFFFIWFTSFQRKCNQKQKKDNSIQIVNSPFLVKIKRSKLVIFKLPLSKRHLDINLLDNIIRKLASNEELPEKNKDHALTGNWIGHRECHIQPDWLLVYRIENDLLVLTLSRTGTHSDLFGK